MQKEVNAIRQAKHIHVVTLVRTYLCGGKFAIIMEPVAEDSLDVYLRYTGQCNGDVLNLY
jgi:hypothetical protein